VILRDAASFLMRFLVDVHSHFKTRPAAPPYRNAITTPDGADDRPVPRLFVALTVHLYVLPAVSVVTRSDWLYASFAGATNGDLHFFMPFSLLSGRSPTRLTVLVCGASLRLFAARTADERTGVPCFVP